MDSTIHTIGECKLNKNEIDILCEMARAIEIQEEYSITELATQTNMFETDTSDAVEMLILHGLLANCPKHTVHIPETAYDWLDEHCDSLYALRLMLDTSLLEDSETAEA